MSNSEIFGNHNISGFSAVAKIAKNCMFGWLWDTQSIGANTMSLKMSTKFKRHIHLDQIILSFAVDKLHVFDTFLTTRIKISMQLACRLTLNWPAESAGASLIRCWLAVVRPGGGGGERGGECTIASDNWWPPDNVLFPPGTRACDWSDLTGPWWNDS